jgi:type II secretory pathway component GspD/PulD (secretin)
MRRSVRATGVAIALLLGEAAAFAEEPPKPAPAPPPAAPAPAPAPAAPVPEKKPVPILFEENRVESTNGWVVWYYSVNFVDPKVLRTELDQWKTPEAKIEPMSNATGQPSNLLRIQERKENLPLIEKMLEILDQPQPQVLVRAKLVEITYTGSLEWGFETTYTAPGDTFLRGGSGVFNPNSFLNATTTRPFQGGTFNFSFVGDSKANYGSLDSVIRLLKSKGKAEILAEPNILATQGFEAHVRAGEKYPIQTATFNSNVLAITTAFEPTGVDLFITPELIGKDAVRMKLREQYSAVTGLVIGQAGTQNPIINQREASTTLTVRDGATLVVGGLQSTSTIDNESGIPLLMDIPILGWLFSTKSKQTVKTELYFIATPQIIRGSYSEGIIQPPGERDRLKGIQN